MIRKGLSFLAVLALSLSASAGDCLSGSSCGNACPLAQQANERISTGVEAVHVSETMRRDFVESVLGNLEAI